MVVPFITAEITAARDSARRRMLARLVYPPPPTAPGVYPVTAEPLRSFGNIVLRTPLMPLELIPETSMISRGSLKFQVTDVIEGTVRVEPPDTVSVTVYGPPNTWQHDASYLLTLVADGETLRVATGIREYHGDGWGLKEQDRLDFAVPTEFVVRMAIAETPTGTLDGRPFTIPADEQAAIRAFAAYLAPGIEVKPPK